MQPQQPQQQSSTKAIKKKSLLNFRAIKNNYVVKPTNNTGMSMVENDLSAVVVQHKGPGNGFVANSAMAQNTSGTGSS